MKTEDVGTWEDVSALTNVCGRYAIHPVLSHISQPLRAQPGSEELQGKTELQQKLNSVILCKGSHRRQALSCD